MAMAKPQAAVMRRRKPLDRIGTEVSLIGLWDDTRYRSLGSTLGLRLAGQDFAWPRLGLYPGGMQ